MRGLWGRPGRGEPPVKPPSPAPVGVPGEPAARSSSGVRPRSGRGGPAQRQQPPHPQPGDRGGGGGRELGFPEPGHQEPEQEQAGGGQLRAAKAPSICGLSAQVFPPLVTSAVAPAEEPTPEELKRRRPRQLHSARSRAPSSPPRLCRRFTKKLCFALGTPVFTRTRA